jgi:putative DNA primase/helicase
VLYVDGEMSAAEIKQRLGRLGPTPDDLHFMMAGLDRRDFLDLASIEGQIELCQHWGPTPELLVLDNLSSLVGYSSNNPDAWTDFQTWLLDLRRAGVAVLILHHANKKGLQRGTSRREDVLDMVLAMRRPTGYAPSEGARFELHFEKARGLVGDALEPIEARMHLDDEGRIVWDWGKAEDMELRQVAALLRDGWKPYQIARELGISKSKAYRLRQQAESRCFATRDQ